jgi:hypothetical protein
MPAIRSAVCSRSVMSALHDANVRAFLGIGQILGRADGEIVDQDEPVLARQPVGEMAADEAPGPGDHDPEIRQLHACSSARCESPPVPRGVGRRVSG